MSKVPVGFYAVAACITAGLMLDNFFLPSAQSAPGGCSNNCQTRTTFTICNGNNDCNVFDRPDCYFCTTGSSKCLKGTAQGTNCFIKGAVTYAKYSNGLSSCGCSNNAIQYFEEGLCDGTYVDTFATTHYVCNILQP